MGAGLTSGGCCNCARFGSAICTSTCTGYGTPGGPVGEPASFTVSQGGTVIASASYVSSSIGFDYDPTLDLTIVVTCQYGTQTVTLAAGLHPSTTVNFDYSRIPSCACACNGPTSLTMTSADESCNFDMFQSCTITWQETPPAFLAANLPDHAYLSYPEGFVDPVSGATFYYYLTCDGNLWTLTRIFLESPYGSPFRDAVLYSWSMGGYMNTCDPFRLDAGSAFPGSDLSCSVTIDG